MSTLTTGLVRFADIEQEHLAATVATWLNTTQVASGQTLGPWLVASERRDEWGYTPTELVFETVGLALGAPSDMYDEDTDQYALFVFPQLIDGKEDGALSWYESRLSGGLVELVATDEWHDTALPAVAAGTVALATAFVTGDTEEVAVAALRDAVARLLSHLREHLHLLPTPQVH